MSITNPQLKSHSKQTSFPSHKSLTRAKVIPNFDFIPDEDAGQTQSHSPPSFAEDPKELLICDFLQRRDEIIKKISQISQQTEDEKKRVFELRRLIFLKHLIQEATCIQDLLTNHDIALSNQILQELVSDAELEIRCSQRLQKFYQAQQSLFQTEKMNKISHMIESTWEQIYRFSVYDPFLINKVCQLEWTFRATEVLCHDRADYSYPFIEYCEILKKGALVSQSEEIIASQLSQRIEEELQRYQSLIERVKPFFNQDGSSDSKQKMDAQQVQELLQELKEFGFVMKKVAENIEEVLACKIEEKFRKFLNKKALVSTNDLIELMIQINNSPVKLAGIEEQIIKLVNSQEKQVHFVLQDLARRIIQGNLEMSLKYVSFAEKGPRNNETIEEIWRACQDFQNITRYSEELIQGLQVFNFEDLCILSRETKARGHEHIRAELWLAKVRFIQIFCESLIKPFNPITFEEIRSFLPEIEDYVNSLPVPKRVPFDKQIFFLHRLLREIKIWIGEERDKQEKIDKTDKILYGFIDVTKEMVKPAEKQQKSENLKLQTTGIQLQKKSLNGKRMRVVNETQEIHAYEKVEKKMKTHNEKHQLAPCSFAVGNQRKSQPEIIIIED